MIIALHSSPMIFFVRFLNNPSLTVDGTLTPFEILQMMTKNSFTDTSPEEIFSAFRFNIQRKDPQTQKVSGWIPLEQLNTPLQDLHCTQDTLFILDRCR
jgi:hypothetical protein